MIYLKKGVEIEQALSETTHLAIGAHQDDIEIMAPQGILECFGSEQKQFSCIVLNDGKNSPRSGIYKDMSDDEMGRVRLVEQEKAAMIGDYHFAAVGGFTSGMIKDLDDSKIEEFLTSYLIKVKPEVIYLHNPFDKHPTHVGAMKQVIKVLRKMDEKYWPREIYGCEVWRGLDWLSDEFKVIFPLKGYENILESLIKVHDSQINGGKRYDLAIMGRRYANATFYQSHEVDINNLMAYGIDLMPLLDKNMDYKTFLVPFIEKLKEEVLDNY